MAYKTPAYKRISAQDAAGLELIMVGGWPGALIVIGIVVGAFVVVYMCLSALPTDPSQLTPEQLEYINNFLAG